MRRSLRFITGIVPSIAAAYSLLAACGTERVELRPDRGLAPDAAGELASGGSEAVVPEPGDAEPEPSSLPGRPSVVESGVPAITDLEAPIPGAARGCSKVDFLFVVDNSLSMQDEQFSLAASVPAFIDVVQQTLEITDFNIMVVDTDGRSFQDLLDGSLLDAFVGGDDPCATALGAGKAQSSEGDICGIAGEARFISEGQTNLTDTFACLARVGTAGDNTERPVDAMLSAVGDLSSAGSCNAGFLRQDAILVVTLISDEDDDRSDGEPEDWRSALLGIKNGDEDAVVVLGLLGDNNLENGTCGALDADAAPRLQSFAKSLGLISSVCADDYAPFLERAVGWIAATCDDFVAPVR